MPGLADLVEEFGDRVGFLGLLIDFDNRNLAINQLSNANADFLNVSDGISELRVIASAIHTGFVPTAGIFDLDGNLIGEPIRGGVPGYRRAILEVLNQ